MISAGEVSSADSLIDALWGQSPPASADKLLQVSVSRLRQSCLDLRPARERFQSQAMVCLYRLGRHTEALERFSELRATLDRELGLEPGAAIRDTQIRILRHDPSLAAPADATVSSGLPASTSRLVGRGRELSELAELLGEERVRLIVLTGAGGSGKTRLAIEAARQNAHKFANGAVFVLLSPVRDPQRVPAAIADAVGLDSHAGPRTEPLLEFVSALELLLAIDNVEHLQVAVTLLAHASRLTLLATSAPFCTSLANTSTRPAARSVRRERVVLAARSGHPRPGGGGSASEGADQTRPRPTARPARSRAARARWLDSDARRPRSGRAPLPEES